MASDVMGKNIKIGNASTETVLFTIEEMVQFVVFAWQRQPWNSPGSSAKADIER